MPLTYSEFEVLYALLRAHGRLLSRQELLDSIFGGHEFRDPRAIDVHVHFLRDKLAAAGGDPELHRHRSRRRISPRADRDAWHRPGLRAQLALALLATSAVTLFAAVATLVPPLEHRLDSDRLRDVRALARTADLGLARLPRRDLRQGSARQNALVRELARRMGGRVALFDAHGIELADTDPERIEPRSATPERLVDAGFARSGDVRDQVRNGEAVVVAPVRTRAGRRTLVLRKSLDDNRAAVAVVRRAVPVAGGVAIVLAAALGIALGFGLLRRLERLRRDARRLADEGIEQPLVLDSYRDEVGEVALALELMRSRLHAEERGRQAFLATASHELRTPLASLRGTVELLEEELACGAPDLGGVRRRAAAARRQTDRLTSLAEDLLDLGRLDGDAALAREPMELGELAGTMSAEVAADADAAGVGLELDAPRRCGPRATRGPRRACSGPCSITRCATVRRPGAW